jgi:hypothetical protein
MRSCYSGTGRVPCVILYPVSCDSCSTVGLDAFAPLGWSLICLRLLYQVGTTVLLE